jgi:dynein heavy chain
VLRLMPQLSCLHIANQHLCLDTDIQLGDTSLDVGLERMSVYRARVAELAKAKEELTNAQLLFGLEVTGYPMMAAVEAGLKNLELIYNLYEDYNKCTIEWSGTLFFKDLNVDKLNDGMDDLTTKLKKLPKVAHEFGVFRKVEEQFVKFRSTIPLLTQLKSDSLRERHWNKLMQLTGKQFNLDANTFTLGKLFEMDLGTYTDQV